MRLCSPGGSDTPLNRPIYRGIWGHIEPSEASGGQKRPFWGSGRSKGAQIPPYLGLYIGVFGLGQLIWPPDPPNSPFGPFWLPGQKGSPESLATVGIQLSPDPL